MPFPDSLLTRPRFKISSLLLLWFLVLSLIPCVVLDHCDLILSTRSLQKSVRQELLAILDAKIVQIENFIRERRATSPWRADTRFW